MGKKRIVLVVTSFPQVSETFIVRHFLGLLDRGWDVHLVCNKVNNNTLKYFNELNERVLGRIHSAWPVTSPIIAFLLFPLAFMRCAMVNPVGLWNYFTRGWKKHTWKIVKRFYLDAAIIALKPDLIHFEFGATAVGRANIGDLLVSKLVVSFRGYDLNFSGLDQADYYADVWEYSDGFHFLGKDLRKRALSRGCPPETSFACIPPGIDCDKFSPASSKQDAFVGTVERPLRILSVGRLEWKKGYPYALQAVRQVIDSGLTCEYRIVGEGASLTEIAFTVRDLNLDQSVHLMGKQPLDEVRRFLGWADVFLHPSLSEGFCNAVLEAQAAEVPVVTSDAGGLSENVVDGVTGFIVHRRDVETMAQRLVQLAQDPALRRQMGKAGRTRVQEKFLIPRQIQAFSEFYQQVLREENAAD